MEYFLNIWKENTLIVTIVSLIIIAITCELYLLPFTLRKYLKAKTDYFDTMTVDLITEGKAKLLARRVNYKILLLIFAFLIERHKIEMKDGKEENNYGIILNSLFDDMYRILCATNDSGEDKGGEK